MRLTEAVLGTPMPILIGQDRASWKLIYYGNFQSKQAQTSSGGGSGLGKSGSPSYVYSADVAGAICMGPVNSLNGVWSGTSSGGKYAVETVTETYTIPASGTAQYTVSQAAVFANDQYVSFQQPYSVTVNDYGSPGGTTLSGNTQILLQPTTNPTPGVNQYYVNAALGQYTFNTANAASATTVGNAVSFVEGNNHIVVMYVSGMTPQQGQSITFGTMTTCTWLSGHTVTLQSAAPITAWDQPTGQYQIVFTDPTSHAAYPTPNIFGQQTQTACTGTVTPNSSATGGGVATITYTVYAFVTVETELADAASTVTVEYQNLYTANQSVLYYPSGVALTATNLPQGSLVAGEYNPNAGNYLFATADFGLGVSISYTWTQQNTDANAPSQLSLTFFTGTLGQAPWPYLSSSYPEFALGYSELCYGASEGMYLGYTNMLPELSFEIGGMFQWGGGDAGGIVDANPAEAIYGLLTNPAFKYNFPAQNIDDSLLVGNSSARNFWAANSYFVSSVLDQQSSLMSVFGDWCEAGQCYISWDEGRMKFVPLGDTSAVGNGIVYTPNTSPIISLDDNDIVIEGKKDPIVISQTPWQSRWNRVAARWSVRTNDYNDDILQVEDEASVNESPGFLIAEDAQDWQFLKTEAAAQFAANLRVQRYSSIYTTYKFALKSNLAFLSPGDIIVLQDGLLGDQGYMFTNQPVRITSMTDNPDAKGIEIEAETFPWSVGASLLNNVQAQVPSNTNNGPQEQPGATSLIAVEIPDGAGLYEGDIVKIAGNGAETSWGGYQLWVSDDGVNYTFFQQVDTPARIGVTTADFPYSATNPDLTDTLTVNMAQSGAQLLSASTTSWNNFSTLSALISPGANISPNETAQAGSNIGTTSSEVYASQGPYNVTYAEDVQYSVGPLTAGVAVNGTGSTGNQTWTSLGYVGGSTLAASVRSGTVPASGTNYKTTLPLKATDFGFNLPSSFVPGGVEVSFNQGYTTAGIPVISVGPVSVTTYSNNGQTRGWPGGLFTVSSPASGTAPARNSFPYTTSGVNSLVFNQVIANYPINGFSAETNVGVGGGYKLNPMVAVNQTTSGNYASSVTLAGTQCNENSGNFAGFVLDCTANLTVTTAGTYTFYVDYANVSSFAVYIGNSATFSSPSYQGGNSGNAFPSTGPVAGHPLAIVSTNMSAAAHPLMVSTYVTFPAPGVYPIEVVYNQYLSTQFSYDNNGYFQITWLAGEQNQAVGAQGPGVGTQFLPTPSNTTDGEWTVKLLKAGTAVGTAKTATATFGDELACSTPITLGAFNDLWSVSGGLAQSDVNASNFGVEFSFTDSTGTTNDTVAINAVKVEVFGYTPVWSNPTNIEGNSGFASCTLSATTSGTQPAESSHELVGNFTGPGTRFSLPASGIGPITGIEVLFNASASVGTPTVNAQLIINGNPAGAARSVQIGVGEAPYTLGSDVDLWGQTTIMTSSVNSTAFGVILTADTTDAPPVTETVEINDVQLQVFWNGGNNGSAWTNPGNVSSVSSYATSTLSPTPTTNTLWLFASSWAWQLPFGLEISGFEVEVDSYSSTSGAILIAQLVYQGLLLGTAKTVSLGTTVGTYQFGSGVDEWGIPEYGLTLGMMMDASFGVAFQVLASNGSTAYVRNVRGTVYGGSATNTELIAYQTATLTGLNQYELTNVWRGLYGSYPIDNPAGAQFVRLDNNTVTYKVNPTYRGTSLWFKALSFNAYGQQLQSLSEVTALEIPILSAGCAPGAIDAATGQLTTGTANQSVFRIDPAIDAIHGGYGVSQIPFGYALAQPFTGNQTPIWTQISSGGGGSGNGGLSTNWIIGLIDFGMDTGAISRGSDVTVAVPATWVTATSVINCSPYGLATATHGEQDGVVEGLVCQAETLTPGVGFTLHVYSPLGSWGQYAISIVGN